MKKKIGCIVLFLMLMSSIVIAQTTQVIERDGGQGFVRYDNAVTEKAVEPIVEENLYIPLIAKDGVSKITITERYGQQMFVRY